VLQRCRHRPMQYLNNILEQDRRAIKRRVKAKQDFREFQAARRTIEGYQAMLMIRKGQARCLATMMFADRITSLTGCLIWQPETAPRASHGTSCVTAFRVVTLPMATVSR
jgi:hypothetical protein